MSYYLDAIKKYVCFSGKSTRKEYWMFVLMNFIIAFVLGIVQRIFFGEDASALTSLYSLFIFLPSLGIGVRRLHDIGKSGFWYFINVIPVVGQIIFLVFMCMPSKQTNY